MDVSIPKVNIVPSEGRGWIIGRIINELSVHNGWTVGDIDNNADINYFINYHATNFLGNSWPKTFTAAWFTHPETPEFFNVARRIDIRVCHALKYAQVIDGHVIPPGIDPVFVPHLRLGVVGRNYPSGRKGEFLLQKLKQLDFVDIVFPPPLQSKDSEVAWLESLHIFYGTLDALLVTSLLEGGPIPAAEATACGIPVIAPSTVGNLSSLDVVDYKVGNFEDLCRVLQKFVQPKFERASIVSEWTWEHFAIKNKKLFTEQYVKLVSKKAMIDV
ncbi:glycosyltransferase [Desulfobacter latus]|uniref:Glycosyltransferase n=1 Tax=Desulfobacter latus TaxID=2292 RepID=A0A850TBE6_9BACT|nr:glycosyltransferase [Desulfobacter latus]NWH06755.1 glycosyltransferase [Desulfobacter latus]